VLVAISVVATPLFVPVNLVGAAVAEVEVGAALAAVAAVVFVVVDLRVGFLLVLLPLL
jgi:hypothetical protein